VTQIAERIGLVIEGRIPLDAIAVGGPGAQIDQTAALGAERALRALGPPDDGTTTGGALDHAGLRGIAHRLQKVILKNNINYCFLYVFLNSILGSYTSSYTHSLSAR
jgi:hypothetical protein